MLKKDLSSLFVVIYGELSSCFLTFMMIMKISALSEFSNLIAKKGTFCGQYCLGYQILNIVIDVDTVNLVTVVS